MRIAPLLLLTLALCSCSHLAGRVAARMTSNLSAAVLNQNDPATVRDGAPAYLLLIDGLIEGSPENAELLLIGASLYGAYATTFVEDPDRAGRLGDRARQYGLRALCVDNKPLCRAVDSPFEEFRSKLIYIGPRDVALLYGFASSWAVWVQTNSNDWNAIAQIPKIEAAMRRVVDLDDGHAAGGAHLYLGVLMTLRPASLGGRPEEGRQHFERAVELSEGMNLMVKVLYARQYARLVFARELHDRLLLEVVEADPKAPELTLSNVLAQQEARDLLDAADDYF